MAPESLRRLQLHVAMKESHCYMTIDFLSRHLTYNNHSEGEGRVGSSPTESLQFRFFAVCLLHFFRESQGLHFLTVLFGEYFQLWNSTLGMQCLPIGSCGLQFWPSLLLTHYSLCFSWRPELWTLAFSRASNFSFVFLLLLAVAPCCSSILAQYHIHKPCFCNLALTLSN